MDASEHASGGPVPAGALLHEPSSRGEWRIERSASRVAFSLPYRWGMSAVHGHFAEISGSASVSDMGDVSLTVEATADSVEIAGQKWSARIRSEDFLNVGDHATLSFISREIDVNGNAAHVYGDLAIAGWMRLVEFDATLRVAAGTKAVSAETRFSFDRRQFGMAWNPFGIAPTSVEARALLIFVQPVTQA